MPSLCFGQANNASGLLPGVDNHAENNTSCNSFVLQTTETLSFKQRGCYYIHKALSPELLVSSVAFAVLDKYRNQPFERKDGWSRFPHRLESYYARHEARDAAEFLVGYLHHEDPRPRMSAAKGFWRRTDAAVMSVVTSPDADGNIRPAFAPIAGSFGSAVAGSLMYRHSESVPMTFAHAGAVYGFYIVKALSREFKPEMVAAFHKLFN